MSIINHLQHPDHTIASSSWSEDQILHVVGCFSNPFRRRSTRENANDFRRHMAQSPNVKLTVIELAYGDRPWEVTDAANPNDIQLRTRHELFHKENMQQIAISHLPDGWQNGAVIDMDFHFTRHDWALEAVHQLQMYDFVQLFSSYTDLSGEDLSRGHRPIGQNNSFAYNYWHHGGLPEGVTDGGWATSYDYGGPTGWRVGATGGAWAFRRSAFDAVGGLMDRCILGHGDWFMAFGLVGSMAPDMRSDKYAPGYLKYIQTWQERAKVLKANIGYVDGHCTHAFHGSKGRRGYSSRDKILVDHQYDPYVDVFPNSYGVLQLTPEKPKFRDAIRRYFLSRSEDRPHEG